jgi:hypothetical protein
MLSFYGLKPGDLDDFTQAELRKLAADLEQRRAERKFMIEGTVAMVAMLRGGGM